MVRRALKVLSDREVSPQLGLLKSTLLQLDSSFSERDYGAGTFRDFAEKLEKQGYVTLKHNGRSTLVELAEEGFSRATGALAATGPASAEATGDEPADGISDTPVTNGNLAEGVALIRELLAEAPTPPRWPMYVRQLKQFIRNARPDFDERRYGSILDLMRACQKDGFLRLERDRQGGLRVFASGPVKASSVPHGWSTLVDEASAPPVVEAVPIVAEPVASEPEASEEDPDDARGNVASAAEIKAKRPRRAAAKAPAAKRARKAPSKARTPSRRTRASGSTARGAEAADQDGPGGGNR